MMALLFSRSAAALLPPSSAAAAAAAASGAAARLFCSSTSSRESGPTRGRTAGELGDDAAKGMQGAEDSAASAGTKVEPRVSQGFVPSGDATPSPDSAGRTGAIGSDVMGDMVDMVHAAVKGDSKRATADIEDMARPSDANTSASNKPPHTTSQDWPRGSIADPPSDPGIGASPFVNTDEASGAGVDRYEGTIPRTDPSEELPEVDQDPPGSVAAGPTAGYAGRANATSLVGGSDNRPI